MEKRLKWNAIGLITKTEKLKNFIALQLDQTPQEYTNIRKTLRNFLDELQNLLKSIELIESVLLPKLEKILRIHFETPEMVFLALCRPSLNNLFEQLQIRFQKEENSAFPSVDFKELCNIGDVGDTLALIGDAALDLATIESFWDSSISKIGELTKSG